jgi:hypothetical protein
VLGTFESGTGTDVTIAYSANGEAAEGELAILSNDPVTPVTIITLLGGSGFGDLMVEPTSVDFGVIAAGGSGNEAVTLRNTGGATLTVTGLSTETSAFGYVVAEPTPFTIGAGGSVTVSARFSPSGPGTFTDVLRIASNAPAGVTEVTLRGTSGPAPVAVCDVSPRSVEPGTGTVDWIGNTSYDPDGYAITRYDWMLTRRPSGSAAIMPGAGGGTRRGFTPDVAGVYEGTLIVTNSQGVSSAPCVATLDATVNSGLAIEMYWVQSGDDMDLHLVNPGTDASARLTTGDDCYYANCTSGLDWGVRGTSSDDPSLDLAYKLAAVFGCAVEALFENPHRAG